MDGTLLLVDHDCPLPPSLKGAQVLRLPNWADSTLSPDNRLYGVPDDLAELAYENAQAISAAVEAALRKAGASDAAARALRGLFETHSATPLCEAVAIAEAACSAARPDRIIALADARNPGFWTGRLMAPVAAGLISHGIPRSVITLPPLLGRAAGLLRPAALVAAGLSRLRRIAQAARRASAEPSQCDVLLLVHGPVAERLASAIAELLQGRGLRSLLVFPPWQRPSSGGYVAGHLAAGRLLGRLPAIAARALPCSRRMQAAELRFRPEWLRALRLRILALCARDWPLMEWMAEDASALLDCARPAVAVAFHLHPRELAPLAIEAARRGLPLVFCQHGLMTPPRAEPPAPFALALVFNQYSADLLAPVCPAAEVKVVGNPFLTAQPAASDAVADLRQGRGGVAVLATQPLPLGPDGGWVAAALRALARMGWAAAVKLHPNEPLTRADEYRRILKATGCPGRVVQADELPLGRLIAACDLFLTQFSSSVLEALAAGKPCVFVDTRPGPPFYPFDESPLAVRAGDAAEVEAAIRRALQVAQRGTASPEHDAFRRRHLEPADGRALERIADAIAEACRANRSGSAPMPGEESRAPTRP